MDAIRIPIQRTTNPRPKPEGDPGFGKHFADHVFRVDWTAEEGWRSPRIEPYGPISLDPAASVLHYGQALFEGSKVFRGPTGRVRVFRLDAHAKRLNVTAQRLCMPELPAQLLADGIRALVRLDEEWVPRAPGAALYLRPFMFATEAFLGVRPSRSYTFMVISSPVGGYFGPNARPLKIWVEKTFSRAAPGGIGAAKAAANYAASLYAAEAAKARGFDQVLWLDSSEHRFVEEIGTMNVVAQIGDALVTPPLGGTILPGITRDTLLTLARDLGVRVEERPLLLEELIGASREGALRAFFGVGTAAAVAPIGELAWDGGSLAIPDAGPNAVHERLRRALEAIRTGDAPDPHGWIEEL
jgi:branched-chain amino acid aminotransferase